MSIDWTQHSLTVRQTYGDSLSATRHIRHMLLTAITAGDVAPGARYTETELGKQLGFSRTPLREAVAALKAEGIVETGEGGSLQVRVLAYHDIHALYEMRATLEGMAARLAAIGASPAEKLFIDEIRTNETKLIKNQAPAADLARMNSKFHHGIFLASHNGFLLEALERLSQIMVLLGPTAYPILSSHGRRVIITILVQDQELGKILRSHLLLQAKQTMLRLLLVVNLDLTFML